MTDDAQLTHRAAVDWRPQLAELVGPADWPAVAAHFAQLDAAWEAAGEGERMRLAAQYRDALAPYPRAYERLRAVARGASAARDVLRVAAGLADELGDAAGAGRLWQEAEAITGRRIIVEQGVGRPAYSIKLRNLDFDFWELALTMGGVLEAVDTLTDPTARPFALAGAVLMIIGGIGGALKRPIDVDDTSVFLGLAAAADDDRRAALADIVAATNAERAGARVYLTPLTADEVEQALRRLCDLGSVERVADVWRMEEDIGRT